MKILVTGGAGFIGAALCRSLAVEGHEVVAADNLNDYYPTVLKTARLEYNGIRTDDGASGMTASSLFPNLSFVKVSIEDRDPMDRLFSAAQGSSPSFPESDGSSLRGLSGQCSKVGCAAGSFAADPFSGAALSLPKVHEMFIWMSQKCQIRCR